MLDVRPSKTSTFRVPDRIGWSEGVAEWKQNLGQWTRNWHYEENFIHKKHRVQGWKCEAVTISKYREKKRISEEILGALCKVTRGLLRGKAMGTCHWRAGSMNCCRTTFRGRTGMLQWLEDGMKWKEPKLEESRIKYTEESTTEWRRLKLNL